MLPEVTRALRVQRKTAQMKMNGGTLNGGMPARTMRTAMARRAMRQMI